MNSPLRTLLLSTCTTWGTIVLTLAAAGIVQGQDINPSINPTVPDHAAPPSHDQDAPIERVEVDWYTGTVDERVDRVLALMTLDEKIGQLYQIAVGGTELPPDIAADIRHGRVGSVFYTGSAELTREAKRVAREESRLGIPLLTPRDVIHGFRTVFPIPLGQAASWDPELVEQAAAIAGREARGEGVNWTFAPMLDISRDARWGRIAESPGEDPLLASALAKAWVEGYQSGGEGWRGIAACGKHFVAYGLSEGGRDYNRAQVAPSELLNVYLKPFQAAVDSGCLTIMTGFNTINGVPATGNEALVRGVLKDDWGFNGLVVSDWSSVLQLIDHGYAADREEAALRAMAAGVDMEMATTTYTEYLKQLLTDGRIDEALIDDAVRRILRVKLLVALPPRGESDEAPASSGPTQDSLDVAKQLASESIVLLKNDGVLPLDPAKLKRVAVIGPLADSARDQLGCWMLDGHVDEARTPLTALRETLGDRVEVVSVPALKSPIDEDTSQLAAAAAAAKEADVALVFVGEGWWMNGEARCRVDLSLSGAQAELVRRVADTGTPTVLVCLAGRPLTIGNEVDQVGAVLYLWHPGTMGGPALADVLVGAESPSGKLPVTFPKHVGQSPLYYNHPSTGRPALPDTYALIGSGQDDYPELMKYRSHYIDSDPFPLFPFGYGLSYGRFEYGDIELSTDRLSPGQTLAVRVPLKNTGDRDAVEVAQLYVQDVTGTLVRPVSELKSFRRVRLSPGEQTILEFSLAAADLAYFDNEGIKQLEPGEFCIGVGGSSAIELTGKFRLHKGKLAEKSDRLTTGYAHGVE